jgi:hypothetical protein
MLFDIRGRRKHVVRVVYAILALLMGASLFLVVGPFSLGSLGGGGGATSAAKVLQEQSERTEQKLRREPESEALLLALTRSRITAKEPKANTALLVSQGYFSLAEGSSSLEEVSENVEGAAKTQRLAAEAQPTINSLTTLAIYEYYAGNFAAGDKAVKQAEAKAPTKAEAKEVGKQMAEYRKRGVAFEKQKQAAEKEEAKTGKERLQNPLGGLSGSTGTLGE